MVYFFIGGVACEKGGGFSTFTIFCRIMFIMEGIYGIPISLSPCFY